MHVCAATITIHTTCIIPWDTNKALILRIKYVVRMICNNGIASRSDQGGVLVFDPLMAVVTSAV